MIKRLLVGVAGTPALQAKISCAVDLARHHGAEINILSVVDVDRLSLSRPGADGRRKVCAGHAQGTDRA